MSETVRDKERKKETHMVQSSNIHLELPVVHSHPPRFFFLRSKKVTFSEENIPQSMQVPEALQSQLFSLPATTYNNQRPAISYCSIYTKRYEEKRTRNGLHAFWSLENLVFCFSLKRFFPLLYLLSSKECIQAVILPYWHSPLSPIHGTGCCRCCHCRHRNLAAEAGC